jgi:hypothetical protein
VVQQGSGEDIVRLREFSALPLNPCHPDFESRVAREESFNNWSSGNHLGPHALAGAGFFYSGNAASTCRSSIQNLALQFVNCMFFFFCFLGFKYKAFKGFFYLTERKV